LRGETEGAGKTGAGKQTKQNPLRRACEWQKTQYSVPGEQLTGPPDRGGLVRSTEKKKKQQTNAGRSMPGDHCLHRGGRGEATGMGCVIEVESRGLSMDGDRQALALQSWAAGPHSVTGPFS